MQRSIIYLPPLLLRRRVFDFELDVRGRAAGETVTGAGQVVYGVKPRWQGVMTLILAGQTQLLVWRAILSAIRGRINVLDFPLYDPLRATLTDAGYPSSAETVPHSDDATFDDGAEYRQTLSLPAVGAAAGATSLLVNGDYVGNALQPGHYFSIDRWLYRVKTISGSGSATTIEFEPPLRATVSIGDELRLDAVAQWVLPADLQGSPRLGVPANHAEIDLQLIEYVNR